MKSQNILSLPYRNIGYGFRKWTFSKISKLDILQVFRRKKDDFRN